MGPPELRFAAANKNSFQQQQQSDLNTTHLKATHSLLNEREGRGWTSIADISQLPRVGRDDDVEQQQARTLGSASDERARKSFVYIPGLGLANNSLSNSKENLSCFLAMKNECPLCILFIYL